MEEIKYINGNPTNGVSYDWKAIQKEYNRVMDVIVPDKKNRELFAWQFEPSATIWNIEVSERAVGKTTMYLLIGLIMHEMYGTRIEYIRNKADQIRPSNSIEMWATILEHGYISEITHEKYNKVRYNYRAWWLVNEDENGNVVEQDNEELCHMHALTNTDNIKSVYNSPRGDLILYDEFIPTDGYTTENMFLELVQTISTIVRLRSSHKIFCLSNTINPNTHLIHELGIINDVRKLHRGECKYITNDTGLPIRYRWIALHDSASEKKRNILLNTFAFKNPKLSSIVGGDTWEVKNYKHMPRIEHEVKVSEIRIYIKSYADILQCKLCHSSKLGYYFLIHRTEDIDTRHSYIVFTNGDLLDTHYFYGLQLPIGKMLLDYYKTQKIYYSYNDVGALFEEFLKNCKIISQLA